MIQRAPRDPPFRVSQCRKAQKEVEPGVYLLPNRFVTLELAKLYMNVFHEDTRLYTFFLLILNVHKAAELRIHKIGNEEGMVTVLQIVAANIIEIATHQACAVSLKKNPLLDNKVMCHHVLTNDSRPTPHTPNTESELHNTPITAQKARRNYGQALQGVEYKTYEDATVFWRVGKP
ncbi:hypothetical protein K443DRAFT_11021 [Laccaria amethystina LaAM-08-1]|uniref:Uncharacterized protein n=1 Tax=Laccaria amethystina LaAM-08-1 TaxID=1095629 RepID=A0A0C9WK71_9AGAR|nr:hypothetical protein K443DRAFT_11021 [Laccaria amethystina LaAM-08-1]